MLAGRKDKKYLTGYVLVNGRRQPKKFRLISGYVVQVNVNLACLIFIFRRVQTGYCFSPRKRLLPPQMVHGRFFSKGPKEDRNHNRK